MFFVSIMVPNATMVISGILFGAMHPVMLAKTYFF